jgi:eukaryotic-like serine/threonine-protein kinase
MRTLLQEGQRLNTEFAEIPVIVGKFLGSDGQGEVYAAEMAGELVAVKWYRPHVTAADQALRARLRDLCGHRPSSSRFLRPIDLVASPNMAGFGYVMQLCPMQFRGLYEIISGEASASLRSRATAGLEMAEAFQALHAAGYCYRASDFGDVVVAPSSGEVRICDTDNVGPNGIPGFVAGTPGFMAPEIVQRQKFPTTDTDLWSLAVLLFWMFIGQHPLEGRREHEHDIFTKSVQDAFFGAEALFIFDPHDSSNAPVPGYHDGALRFWPIYPQFLRDLFTRAFTVGIRDPKQRVRETEWRQAMAALRDAIMPCPHCGAENFHDHSPSRIAGAARAAYRRPSASSCRATPSSRRTGRRCFRIISTP